MLVWPPHFLFFVVPAARELCSKAANELLTTERTYLSSLSTLIKVYVGPLQEQVTPRQPQRQTPQTTR